MAIRLATACYRLPVARAGRPVASWTKPLGPMKHREFLLTALLPVAALFACSDGSDDPKEENKVGETSGDRDGATGGNADDGDGDAGDGDSATGGDTGNGDGDARDGDDTGTGGFAAMLPAGVTNPKIMIVGDSISAGPGCYKKHLAESLVAEGHAFEFVGAYEDDCGGGVMHSAVSCTTSGQFTQETFTVPNCFSDTEFLGMTLLMATHEPDLVLIQLGVNDVWSGTAPIAPILSNYTTLVEQARAHNPKVLVFVAQIHQIITDNCQNTASSTNAQELVDAVPGWAAGISTETSPVLVADLWTNSDATEANDCVHPNDAGARRMAENWYAALKDIVP